MALHHWAFRSRASYGRWAVRRFVYCPAGHVRELRVTWASLHHNYASLKPKDPMPQVRCPDCGLLFALPRCIVREARALPRLRDRTHALEALER